MSDEEYGCYCEYGGGEPWEFVHESWRTARRNYKCLECGETIKQGERHVYTFGKCAGDVSALRTCSFCARLRRAAYLKHDLDFAYGELACATMTRPEIVPLAEDDPDLLQNGDFS